MWVILWPCCHLVPLLMVIADTPTLWPLSCPGAGCLSCRLPTLTTSHSPSPPHQTSVDEMEVELLTQPELVESAASAKLEAAEQLTKSMLLERQLAEALAEKVGEVDGWWMLDALAKEATALSATGEGDHRLVGAT